ncbi:MAG: S46 family peptidase [Deltaproteobacteria bacterium]|nr:S46 family peptidase [Deltaproteobacteria bacterium]
MRCQTQLQIGFFLALGVVGAFQLHADEGQWMPQQLAELDQDLLKKRGLKLSATELWGDHGEKGLLRAVVNVRGCSGAFLSKEGLLSTNHHCAYGAIQAQSSPENDLLKDGFFAKNRNEEIAGRGLWVRVIHRVDDVTAAVRSALSNANTSLERAVAEERIRKKLVRECEEKQKGHRCQVARFYQGSLFQLVDTVELRDIRLVFAPPSGLGNFGGEVDNWMWPRHSIDFTLLRAYVAKDGSPAEYDVDNVPYVPDTVLKVSGKGVRDGDFVATIGYPGHTDRYLSSAEVQRQVEQVLPSLVDVYGELIDIQKRFSEQDEKLRIKVAARMRSLMNRHKNARGMLDGISRMKLLDKRQVEHEKLKTAAQSTAAFKDVPARVEALSAKRRELHMRDFLLRTLSRGPDSISAAMRLVRWAKEGQKEDAERQEGFQNRDKQRLWQSLERNLRDYSPVVDEALLDALLKRFAKLDLSHRPTSVTVAKETIGASVLLDDKSRLKAIFEARDFSTLRKSTDGAVRLALDLLPLVEKSVEERKIHHGERLDVGPNYFSLLKNIRSGPVYPDANRTLRFSHAQVRGYSPKDGQWAKPQTSLRGQLAKHTGVEPFELPARVREKAFTASKSRFAQVFDDASFDEDAQKDIPACFLASSDTTGGNSGSPVVNGRGELVGFNFDRVWENIAGDFGYHISRSRNVSVDVRYLLWLLDDIYDGKHLLKEIHLADFSSKTSAPSVDTLASVKEKDSPNTRGVWIVTFIMIVVGAGLLISGRRQAE